MDPAPESNTAAENSQPKESAKSPTEDVESKATSRAKTGRKAKQQSASGPAARTASDGGFPEQVASSRSSEPPPLTSSAPVGKTPRDQERAASDAALPLPATEERRPTSVVVPALIFAAVVLLIVSIAVGFMVWKGPTQTPTSPPSASAANPTSPGSGTSAGSATSGGTVQTGTKTDCPAIPNLSSSAAVAITSVGRVMGTTASVGGVSVSRWLGVPYAQSTMGERRFAKPVPITVSDQCVVVDAVKPSPPCAQWVPGTGVVGNEDCLRFNIWAPAKNVSGGDAKRSLVLAATGHWFQRGTNDVPQWEELAAQTGMVVMSPNVRLGVLGFLHPTAKGITDDVAMEDAIAAIKWAQINAAAFGADPSALRLVANGTGGYLIAEAAGRLQLNVSQAVLEGSLYTSAVPTNKGSLEPSKILAPKLGCSEDKGAWSACFSNSSLEVLLSAAAKIDLRFTPAWDYFILFGLGRKLPKFTDVIAGADIAQARALVDEYIRPKAEAMGNVSTEEAQFNFALEYLVGTQISGSVKTVVKSGNHEENLLQLAMIVSGCGTRAAAKTASRGYHYFVDSGSRPLFEPILSTAEVSQFLSNGKVPSLKNGNAWPPASSGSRFLFANGTDVVGLAEICLKIDQFIG